MQHDDNDLLPSSEHDNNVDGLIERAPSEQNDRKINVHSNTRAAEDDESRKKRLAIILAGATALLVVIAVIFLLSTGEKKKKVAVENQITQPLNTDGRKTELDFSMSPERKETIPLDESSQPAATAPTEPSISAEEIAKINQINEARIKSNVMVTGDGATTAPRAGPGGSSGGDVGYPQELQGVYANPQSPPTGQAGSQSNAAGSGGFDPVSLGLVPSQPKAGQTMGADTTTSQGGRFGTGTTIAPSSKANYMGDRRHKILQGKLIDAILLSAVKSDIPGQIIAQTTTDTYGEQSRYPLLPRGTRLFGEYSANVRYGQAEVAAIWRRAITPHGVEIMLDSPSTNGLAMAGIYGGNVDHHYFQSIFVAGMISLLGAGSSTFDVNSDDRDNSLARYRSAVQESFAEQSKRTLEQRANIPPTITIKSGARIKVLVAKDLDFSALAMD